MKMTLHIDDGLLAKVMEITGATTKTRAVDLALREVARRGELRKLAEAGLGLDADELKNVFDADYDLMADRVAEGAGKYGKRSRSC
jgi:Arc/MetJ family transcription regulator